MATVNLQPPARFCFQNTDEWPKWKCRFEQYRQASGLADKGEERQVSTLLYCLGDDAEKILDTTITPDNRNTAKLLKHLMIILRFERTLSLKGCALIKDASCQTSLQNNL